MHIGLLQSYVGRLPKVSHLVYGTVFSELTLSRDRKWATSEARIQLELVCCTNPPLLRPYVSDSTSGLYFEMAVTVTQKRTFFIKKHTKSH